MAQCKFCKEDKDLIRAHIIPQAFVKEKVKPNNKNLICIVKNKSASKIVKANGYFDKSILCESCDNKFGKCEETLIKFLRNNKYYNYRDVSIAIRGILWKAHISTRPEFNEVDLGSKYGGELHSSIAYSLNYPEKLPTQDFSIWIQRYINFYSSNKQDVLVNMITCGHKTRDKYYGSIYYFDFGGYRCIIRIGGKSLPENINKFITSSAANIEDIIYYNPNNVKNIFCPNKTVLKVSHSITLT